MSQFSEVKITPAETPAEIPAAVADVVKPAEKPVEKPAAIAAEIPAAELAADDGEEKVNREELETLKKDAASFRATQNTEAKLKGKYAKLEFIATRCRNMPRDLCMQLLPDTENEKELYAACDRISASLKDEIRRQVNSGFLAYRNMGGSGGGNAPSTTTNNASLSAGELLAMRR